MENINYPTWKSGIPQLLPKINPYRTIDNHYKYYPKRNFNDDIIGYVIHSYNSSTHIKEYHEAKDAWSYMEILQWFREQGIEIDINYHQSDQKYHIDIKIRHNNNVFREAVKSTKDHYEALDEAILFTLNLIYEKNNKF